MTHTPHVGIFLMCICLGMAGCTDMPSSVAPAAPSPTPQPNGVQPLVKAVTPNIASTSGGGWGTISGTQFQSGAIVRLGNAVQQSMFQDETTLWYWTTAQPAGIRDVIVTNPGGVSGILPGAFTFAPQESFDFTGDWIAHAGPDYDTDMRFTIRNNTVVGVGCGSSESVTLSPPPSVHDGQFSFLGADAIAVSGHLVSPARSVGAINMPGCRETRWWADKSDLVHSAVAR
jgi:hypothetical protein